jgi:hypothetical protein
MKNKEIWTCDRLVIKPVIPCQRIDSTQKFKLLDEVLRYDLYYSLISFLFSWFFKKKNGLKKAIFYSPKAHTFLLTGLSMLKRVDFELWRNMFGLLIGFWSEAKRQKEKKRKKILGVWKSCSIALQGLLPDKLLPSLFDLKIPRVLLTIKLI